MPYEWRGGKREGVRVRQREIEEETNRVQNGNKLVNSVTVPGQCQLISHENFGSCTHIHENTNPIDMKIRYFNGKCNIVCVCVCPML